MATENLIVSLEAETAQLRADLDKVAKELENVNGKTKQADKSLLSMENAGKAAGAAVTALATAGTLAATALAAAAVSASAYVKELKTAATISGVSTGRMQELSFATQTVGIDMEKLADISKDTLEKIGDYLNTGGGGFQDFADAMRLTSAQTVATANEFRTMSGPDVLQEMVNRMQEAGVSSVQMSHALEGVASDTTNLIPLLKNNGAEAKKLTDEFNSLGVKLSALDIEKIEGVGRSISRLSAQVSGTTNKVIASLDDEINGVVSLLSSQVSSVGEIVVQAVVGYQMLVAKATSSVMNLFREAEIASVEAAIAIKSTFGDDAVGVIADIDKAVNDFVANATGGLIDLGTVDFLQDAKQSTTELEERLRSLKDADAAAESFDEEYFTEMMERMKTKVDEFKSTVSSEGDPQSPSGGNLPLISGNSNDAELDAIKDRFKSEEELLTAKYEKEQQLARGNKDLLANLEDEYINRLMVMDEESALARQEAERDRYFKNFEELGQEKFDAEIAEQQRLFEAKLIGEEEYLKAVYSLGIKYGKLDQGSVDKINKDKDKSNSNYYSAASTLANAAFEDNKAVRAGMVVVDAASGIVKAFADLPYPAALAASASIAAVGVAQLASISSASTGGGTVSSPSGTSAPVENTSRFSSSVEVNESVAGGGSTSNNIHFTADSSDGLGSAMVKWLNEELSAGSVKLGG